MGDRGRMGLRVSRGTETHTWGGGGVGDKGRMGLRVSGGRNRYRGVGGWGKDGG